ncbi:DJ-1/PfpI family protein [Providencia manganoxydans]|uniref:DJ-1/PfpI family protein n=1 Tax=Providencia manganoxydans TaxID=2923283 RepID=A0ABX7AB63_9GAMM|nr:DJ-1/PfpI family protein [Providencia manganoxydans]
MNIETLGIVLFDGFETLDVMGPVEVFGRLPDCKVKFISPEGNKKTSSQGVAIETEKVTNPQYKYLLIPGGQGTRPLAIDKEYIYWLKQQVEYTSYCMTVCTGSALLAATNLLNDLSATSNKLAFEWVTSINNNVNWQPKARWVKDDKFYTSSGVSAGIDMSLQVVSDFYGLQQASTIIKSMEYVWNDDASHDPFAVNLA